MVDHIVADIDGHEEGCGHFPNDICVYGTFHCLRCKYLNCELKIFHGEGRLVIDYGHERTDFITTLKVYLAERTSQNPCRQKRIRAKTGYD